MSTILVTGGTGTLGRHVVARLRNAGHDVRVLTRQGRPPQEGISYVTGDLVRGEGIEPAVQGAEIILHCAGNPRDDVLATRKLMRFALAEAAASHVVNISVVGAERVPMGGRIDRTLFGYFAMKREAERVVEESGLPWTTLRATQFHDLIFLVASKMAKLPAMPSPSGFRFQPVDADEVAARMVELALGEQPAWCPSSAGRGCTTPQTYSAATFARRIDVARSCRSGSRARPQGRSAAART